jgi:hypothetical protein
MDNIWNLFPLGLKALQQSTARSTKCTLTRLILSTSEENVTQNTVVISVTMTTGLFYVRGWIKRRASNPSIMHYQLLPWVCWITFKILCASMKIGSGLISDLEGAGFCCDLMGNLSIKRAFVPPLDRRKSLPVTTSATRTQNDYTLLDWKVCEDLQYVKSGGRYVTLIYKDTRHTARSLPELRLTVQIFKYGVVVFSQILWILILKGHSELNNFDI